MYIKFIFNILYFTAILQMRIASERELSKKRLIMKFELKLNLFIFLLSTSPPPPPLPPSLAFKSSIARCCLSTMQQQQSVWLLSLPPFNNLHFTKIYKNLHVATMENVNRVKMCFHSISNASAVQRKMNQLEMRMRGRERLPTSRKWL